MDSLVLGDGKYKVSWTIDYAEVIATLAINDFHSPISEAFPVPGGDISCRIGLVSSNWGNNPTIEAYFYSENTHALKVTMLLRVVCSGAIIDDHALDATTVTSVDGNSTCRLSFPAVDSSADCLVIAVKFWLVEGSDEEAEAGSVTRSLFSFGTAVSSMMSPPASSRQLAEVPPNVPAEDQPMIDAVEAAIRPPEGAFWNEGAWLVGINIVIDALAGHSPAAGTGRVISDETKSALMSTFPGLRRLLKASCCNVTINKLVTVLTALKDTQSSADVEECLRQLGSDAATIPILLFSINRLYLNNFDATAVKQITSDLRAMTLCALTSPDIDTHKLKASLDALRSHEATNSKFQEAARKRILAIIEYSLWGSDCDDVLEKCLATESFQPLKQTICLAEDFLRATSL